MSIQWVDEIESFLSTVSHLRLNNDCGTKSGCIKEGCKKLVCPQMFLPTVFWVGNDFLIFFFNVFQGVEVLCQSSEFCFAK